MAFDILNSVRAMQAHLLSSGRFTSVEVGEPKGPPNEHGFTAAIFNETARIAELTLSSTIEVHALTVRMYRNMLAEPEENIELECSRFISEVMDNVIADYSLGGEIRAVDFGGTYGESVGVTWGYGDVGGKMYRIADIRVPLIVNGSTTFAA